MHSSSHRFNQQFLVTCGLLLVLSVGNHFAHADDEPPVVIGLELELPPFDASKDAAGERPDDDRLYIEIARQAVLLAAREHFGLATRDVSLRETLPGMTLGMHIDSYYGHLEYALSLGETQLTSGTVKYSHSAPTPGYVMALTSAQEKSRTEFVTALELAGLTAVEQQPLGDTPLDPQINELLNRMNAECQLAAIMMTHAAIREHGESPALLTALSRGYSHLSQLTVFLHSPMRRVFAARGLLYATRLIVAAPDSPEGHWARAYAFSMLALSAASQHDLGLAAKIESELEEPAWLAFAKLGNEFDFHALKEAAATEEDYQELAALMWYRSVEFSGSMVLNLETGRAAIGIAPSCLRLMHGMDYVAGVSFRHFTTTACVPLYAKTLSESLPEFGAILPKELQTGPESPDPIAVYRFAKALVEQAEAPNAEPSLQILGRLIDETNFLHLRQRATFMRDSLSVETSEFLDQYKEAFESHPYGPLLNAVRLPYRQNPAAYQRLLGDVDLTSCDYLSTGSKLLARFSGETKYVRSISNDLYGRSLRMMSMEEIDRSVKIAMQNPEWQAKMSNYMAGFQPHAPQRFVAQIKHNWPNFEKKVDEEFLERYGRHPAIALQLAIKYDQAGDLEKAAEFYLIAAATAPSFESFSPLILLQYKQGQPEKGIELAEAFLTKYDYGLDHSRISASIAYSLMEVQKFDEAKPWVDRAAESGSGLASTCLADYLEAIGKFDECTQVHQHIYERYQNADNLYNYAARTNRIDPRQAYRLKLKELQLQYPNGGEPVNSAAALQLAVLRDWSGASRAFEEIYAAHANPFDLLMAGVLAGLGGDQARRDELIRRVAVEAKPVDDSEYAAFPIKTAKAIQAIAETGAVDQAALDEIAPHWMEQAHANVYFFVGAYLDSAGKATKAVEYYNQAATSPFDYKQTLMLAWNRLTELGEDPSELNRHYDSYVGWAEQRNLASREQP